MGSGIHATDKRYTKHGQKDGARAIWYWRKNRIYIDVWGEGGADHGAGHRVVQRIFRNTGAVARHSEVFPISELHRIQPLTTRGIGPGGTNPRADLPQPLTAPAIDYEGV